MTFQVFHDLYKPRHMERKFQGGEQSKAKVPSVGKNPLPISLLSYYSLKIKFVPCHHQRVKISEVAKFENSRLLRDQFPPLTIPTKT